MERGQRGTAQSPFFAEGKNAPKKQSDIKKKKTKFKDFEANCKFFFTHVNEWSNDSDQVEQVKLVTDDIGGY